MQPVNSLVQSRKFWVLIIDTVVSLITFFGAKYLAPSMAEDVVFLVGAWQAVALAVVVGIAYEDGKALMAGTHPNTAQPVSPGALEIEGMEQ